ncbi:MAG: ATP-binding protein [Lachnospiraceae bacterium]|nr:ATP-binding protein [Lachnospiraceae bacterium]
MDNNIVKASPTKEFFVNMLVRDIMLKQAIIELIDNSIDGARSIRNNNEYSGLNINVSFNKLSFKIEDNCGGIPLDIAANYAFRFGRPKGFDKKDVESTGIFGIGMKRALFKIGKKFSIHSITNSTEFQLDVDVDEWLKQDDNDWDFRFTNFENNMYNNDNEVGTSIIITQLNNEIAGELDNSEFEKEVIEHIQRRVGLDISYGINIVVNGKKLVGNNISLINNDQIKPIKEEYTDKDIKVTIICGIASREGKNYPPEQAGWYIYCNGRLVVAADKSSLTTWKDMENKSSGVIFHNNYAGFRGIVYFNSNYPAELPWNTTKTGLDETSLVYLRAREKMKEYFIIVKNIIDEIRNNTNENDDGIEETIAHMPGTELTLKNIGKIKDNRIITITNVSLSTVPKVTISYKKTKKEADEIKEQLNVKTYKEVGEKTFEYYKDAEC